MKVRLLTGLCGAQSWAPGDEFECSAAEAARLIESGAAEAITPTAERATKPAPRVTRT